MKSAPQWILLLKVCLSVVFALNYSKLLIAAENRGHPTRKLASDTSDISVDCGVDEDYIDSDTSILYQSDTSFVSTGENHVVSPDHSFDESYFHKQLNSLRSFPNGKKNCYNLKPKEGKNNKYHFTALFAYGNYDYKDEIPEFDVYLGVNYWDTIDLDDSDTIYHLDIIYVAAYDSVDVCLVNTGGGTPIVSLLEFRYFRDSIYDSASNSHPLDLMRRWNLGFPKYSGRHFVRYMDDIYSRIWFVPDYNYTGWGVPINTSAAFNIDGLNDDYKLPRAVLSTAVRAFNLSSSLDISKDYNKSYEYMVYLHFFEFEEQAKNQKRIMDIAFNGESILTEPLTPNYWEPKTIFHNVKLGEKDDGIHISITSTSESDLPAMLNAYEIYRILPQTSLATAQEDVDAMRDIQRSYEIPRISWQGDPCLPESLKWEGLSCSYINTPRVTTLNLSSSNLKGKIATSFFKLTELESLDLSNNELTGGVPEFLAELPNLHVLNLARNKLTGSIPNVLKEKSSTTLLLSLDGNSGLCLRGSCKRKKFVVPLVTSIAALVIITLCSLVIWRFKTKRQEVMLKEFKEEGFMKLKTRAYSCAEVTEITDNFKTIIGEGGFGKVYFGNLQDDTPVAVKLLSLSSMHGCKAFQSEVEFSKSLHHRNLVSLMGYCDEGDVKALIYEYMDNGNLHHNLSEKTPNVLNWKERLQIAVDVAHGLDYLHNGCEPSIIHRDLKTSNILLNANMQAKIADFGLSRSFANDLDSHISTLPAGTRGYLDPQYQISRKSDIYSFGIILFELITGQPAVKQTAESEIHILHWVIPAIEEGDILKIIDQRLQGKYSVASVQKAVDVARACVLTAAALRPDISLVLPELKECLSLEMVHGTNSSIFDS